MDPFSGFRQMGPGGGMMPDNNNLLEAAEKARLMMLYRSSGNPAAAAAVAAMSSGGMPRPPHMSMASGMPPLPPELLARYSAVQATLGMYNPSLLAAALRQANPGAVLPPQIMANPPPLSPKSEGHHPGKPARFSPYVLPSPHHHLIANRSPSGSPPARGSPASIGTPSPPPLPPTSSVGPGPGIQQSSIEVD
jgi:hypothetical protein